MSSLMVFPSALVLVPLPVVLLATTLWLPLIGTVTASVGGIVLIRLVLPSCGEVHLPTNVPVLLLSDQCPLTPVPVPFSPVDTFLRFSDLLLWLNEPFPNSPTSWLFFHGKPAFFF